MNRIAPETSFAVPDDRLYEATRAWLIWLQGLFQARPIGYHKWHPNLTETEIVITDQNPDEIQKTNKRPILYTTRGPAGWASTSLGQRYSISIDSDDKTITDLINFSLTISVIAREGLEAQSIAYSIFRMIPIFKPALMRLGRMHAIGNNVSISPETAHGQIVPGSSSSEWRMVQLSIPCYVQDVISSEEIDFHTLVRAVTLHLAESSS